MSLVIKNLQCTLGNKPVLNQINLALNTGEFIGILGANGAGKSTLIKCIAQIQQYQSGEIFWQNQSLQQYNAQNLAQQRAVLTQQIQVGFNFISKEVVMMGRYPYFKDFPSVTDEIMVDKHLEQTESYELKNRDFLSLSGGEQQRIQISRVFCQADNPQNPQLLLLDEPLNNLDIKHQHQSLKSAQQFAHQGNLVIAVLHDINLSALYADKIILMHQGKCVAFGTPKQVLTQHNLYHCYDYPVEVNTHPFSDCPMVHFGYHTITKNQVIHH